MTTFFSLYALPAPYDLLVVVLAYTGLRFGEAYAGLLDEELDEVADRMGWAAEAAGPPAV